MSYSFCDPMDCSPPGSSVHGSSWIRILGWDVLVPRAERPRFLGLALDPCYGSFQLQIFSSNINSSNIFSDPSFCCSSRTSIIQMLVCLVLSQRSLHLSLFLFVLFSLLCSALVISTFLSSNSLIHPSNVFFISVVVLFITDCFFFSFSAAPAAKSLQSCPTLCDPIDGSPSGSPIAGILQARTLEWVAISFSNA